MDEKSEIIVAVYAASICVLFFFCICLHFRSSLIRFWVYIRIPLLKHLVYRPVITSRRFQEWSRADLLAFATWLGLVSFCLSFKNRGIDSVGRRAANLAVVHLAPLYALPNLDSLSNVVGLQRHHIRRLHASLGIISSLLLTLHVVVSQVSSHGFPLHNPGNVWTIVVSSLPQPPD
jgi:hypothetical protein